MKRLPLFILFLAALGTLKDSLAAGNQPPKKKYTLRYDKPAPLLPITSLDSLNTKALMEATPLDPAWENWSLPIGNGYLGASVFGRTVTERVQLTENSLASKSLYGGVGLTNFAEMYIDFGHQNPIHYSRTLRLDDAVSTVQYQQDGVVYEREYFASYPDKVLVIKLSASGKGKVSFTLRPRIPYQKPFGPASGNNGRMGTVTASDGQITLSGKMECLNTLFEGQFKVIPTGGIMKAVNDTGGGNGSIVVSNADAAVIIVAVGTNYKLSPHIFTEHDPLKKMTDTIPPHAKVSGIIQQASAKTYNQLLASHRKDYTRLFDRAGVDLASTEPTVTTDVLLKNYRSGITDHYLEELYFQYGRYLLICSSRPGTLPPNLQGIWTQYDISPWTGGYWHNINIQMNYWPVFSTNLTELFQSFADYNLAYRPAATSGATQYIRKVNPGSLSPDGDNGWTIGTGASAYNISTPGVHSGPGTGTMTSQMFWEYYAFTRDKKILQNITYPAILGMSRFLSKVVIDTAGLLLTSPSYSPEQRSRITKLHYQTTGCAFDQQMIAQSHTMVLRAAGILGDKNPLLTVLKYQLPRLDPVQVGWSGQVKEYREEKYYGELVDPKHRHISQLIGLYPGTIIHSGTPAWLDAAKVTLNNRGDNAAGWSLAFKQGLWARIKDGDRAYRLYQTLLKKSTLDNLWDSYPPFQIDGNLGGTAGVAEMLLQSHEGFIHLLPALPAQWPAGAFRGLLARGNFEISAEWKDGQARQFTIRSNAGGTCTLHYFNIEKAVIKDGSGKRVKTNSSHRDVARFETKAGDVFTVSALPPYKKVAEPRDLSVKMLTNGNAALRWQKSPDAVAYNIYSHFNSAPVYKLIKSKLAATSFECPVPELRKAQYGLLRVTAVDASGRESGGVNVNIEFQHSAPSPTPL